MRILGLDLGERRVGVALSDPDGVVAHPLTQFEPRGRRDLVATVARLVEEHGAARVVAGLPRKLDGTAGEQSRQTEACAAALREALEVPVVLWDERLSTRRAEREMRRAGLRRRQRTERRDMVAATLILQAYLDAGAPA